MSVQERQRNREVPFPEGVQELGIFEKDLLIFASRRRGWYDWYHLPQEIQLAGLETYINWLGMLTQKDPERRERGTLIHADIRKPWKRLVYPQNPNVGTYNEVNVWAQISKRPEQFVPLVVIHSHPKPSTFSTRDISLFRRKGIHALSTPDENYLVVPTRQSIPPQVQEDDLDRDLEEKALHSKTSLILSITVELVRERNLSEYEISRLGRSFDMALDVTGDDLFPVGRAPRSFLRYLEGLRQALEIAEGFKLGFYYSSKDGVYTRVTREKLDQAESKYRNHVKGVVSRWFPQ